MPDNKKDRLKNIKVIEKIIGIVIFLIILLLVFLSYFLNPLFFIIVSLLFVFFISIIIPILYLYRLLKQPIRSEDYYLEIVENIGTQQEDSLLIKMYEIRINNHRNFVYYYLALLGAFIFATISNRGYFRAITYGNLNEYYLFLSLGIIGMMILIYATFDFDRFTIRELKELIKAMERLKNRKK